MSNQQTAFIAGGWHGAPDKLYAAVQTAGLTAANRVNPVAHAAVLNGNQIVEREGICGSAAVKVYPGSEFYDWAAQGELVKDGAIKLTPDISDVLGQSYERWAAWAHAVVAALIPAGIYAEAVVWID